MGASQSAEGASSSTPVRPRTPLRFGSVPTPQPTNPCEYNTCPVYNLYRHIECSDSITSILSQESYLCPSLTPSSTVSTASSSSITSDAPSAPSARPDPSTSYETKPSSHGSPPRCWCCDFQTWAYLTTAEESQLHILSGQNQQKHHAVPPVQHEPEVHGAQVQWMPPQEWQSPPPMWQSPSSARAQCACQSCLAGYYSHEMEQTQAWDAMEGHMLPIVGLNGPDVEDLSWFNGQETKRKRRRASSLV